MLRPLTFTLCLILCACSSYDVQVNDNLVYSPTRLHEPENIADPALLSCIKANIQEQKATNAKAVTKLICPAGSITNLAGIEQFKNLRQLGLSDNKIQSIEALAQLRKLSQLDLSLNALQSAEALQALELLKTIKLTGNDQLDCNSLGGLSMEDIELPAHCH